MKNVYLVVSDLHDSDASPENRINYGLEMEYVKGQICQLGEKYRGFDSVNLILLGDVFNRSYKEPDAGTLANNFWILMNNYFKNIYTVLGNHETSFYKNNPFYTLVGSIQSEKVRKILHKNWTPKGLQNVFQVPDLFYDGNVAFHFNHYETPINRAIEGKTNIAFYHQDVVDQQIIDAMQANYGSSIYQRQVVDFEKTDIFKGFSYNFFGHLHKVYGTYELESRPGQTTVLCYLASLGRPNVTEVADNFLERCIPAIIVEDGELATVEYNTFNLLDRATCVKEHVVEKQQETYQEVKHRKVVRKYVPSADDPIQELLHGSALLPQEKTVLEDLLSADCDQYTSYLLSEYRRICFD